jgi:hypothetical protein
MAGETGDGRIRVPADLDTVTAVGHEDRGTLDAAALDRIWDAVRHWYQAAMQPAIQLCLRHNGKVVLNRAIGHAWGNGPADPVDAEQIPVTTDTPFCVYSAAKAITTTVVHLLVVVDPAAAELALLAAADLLVVLVAAAEAEAVEDRVVETRAVQLLVHSVVPVVVPLRVASPRSRGVKSSTICRRHLLVA